MSLFDTLPDTVDEFLRWDWPRIEPYYAALEHRPLDADSLAGWIADWGRLGKLLEEGYWWLWIQTTLDTTDAEAERRFHTFLTAVQEPAHAAEHRLKRRLLASGLHPADFTAPLRNFAAEVALFHESNLALHTQEHELGSAYDRIRSLQTVEWQGQETTLVQLYPLLHDHNRDVRERVWRAMMTRQLADREALNAVWTRLMAVRVQLAANAGLPDYRAYRWQQMLRLDYTPADCATFHAAIEAVVVPAVERVLEKRRRHLGLDRLRPWDVEVDARRRPPLCPFATAADLETRGARLFARLDPELGAQFETLRREGLLDLDNRRGKMPSSYCATLPARARPYVFMNVAGMHEDLMILLHECGHAFHSFESVRQPHHAQQRIGTEFHEVAAMAMELLAAPHLADPDGFYTPAQAARARIEHLEAMLRFWPYIAVVDAFQHWAHTHPESAADSGRCDEYWAALWARFMPAEDWSGFDDALKTGWQRKLHIFRVPFYYVDYGLAQVGAAQIWSRVRHDPAGALAAYKNALALAGTEPLPRLFEAAGARLAFDADSLGAVVAVIEATMAELEPLMD